MLSGLCHTTYSLIRRVSSGSTIAWKVGFPPVGIPGMSQVQDGIGNEGAAILGDEEIAVNKLRIAASRATLCGLPCSTSRR